MRGVVENRLRERASTATHDGDVEDERAVVVGVLMLLDDKMSTEERAAESE